MCTGGGGVAVGLKIRQTPDRLRGLLAAHGVLAEIALLYVAVAAVLRLFWLLRPDPFGHALVLKPYAVAVYAVALDALQAGILALPAVALLVAATLFGRPLTTR